MKQQGAEAASAVEDPLDIEMMLRPTDQSVTRYQLSTHATTQSVRAHTHETTDEKKRQLSNFKMYS